MRRYGSLGLSKPHLEPIIGVILSQFNQSKRDWGVVGGAGRGCECWSNVLAQMRVSQKRLKLSFVDFRCSSDLHTPPGVPPVPVPASLLGQFEIAGQCWPRFKRESSPNSSRPLLTGATMSGMQDPQTLLTSEPSGQPRESSGLSHPRQGGQRRGWERLE